MPARTDIDTLYERALGPGAAPFEFQRVIAETGFPEVLDVPTGCGKTPAMLLGWLYRKLLHPDESVREETPTRLIWCMPLRTLTNQTASLAHEWVDRLGLSERVDIHVLMGGEPVTEEGWRMNPDRPTLILSTIDMALSRALNRGYLASRFSWPIDFALFNSDCHWVYDEVQLMGVALPTSRQLHGLRSALGTAKLHGSTWMSATVRSDDLVTVDAPQLGPTLSLSTDDRRDELLRRRLEASKTLVAQQVDDPKRFADGFADIVMAEHRAGNLTLAVVNTVSTAIEVSKTLRKRTAKDGATPLALIHSRFRPGDRRAVLNRVLDFDQGPGLIAVSTQVIEAGIDISANVLVSECAPWSSIVQRAGRCNRAGESTNARLVVVRNTSPGPYESAHLEESWAAVSALHSAAVTPESLAATKVVEEGRPQTILRRRDLLGLFDTAPDLLGNDIDVSRFIRSDQNIDVALVWREFDKADPQSVGVSPVDIEGCPVPVGEARRFLTDKFTTGQVMVEDSLLSVRNRSASSSAIWRRATKDDVRPGAVIVVHSDAGGYSTEMGFDPKHRGHVDPVVIDVSQRPSLDADRSIDDNTGTTDFGVELALSEHLLDVEAEARTLCHAISGLDDVTVETVARAGRLHDLGKAHEVFQEALHAALDQPSEQILAKSGSSRRLKYQDPNRRGFRHEFVSALALLANPELASSGDLDPQLVTYLVGAHHGRVRLAPRSLPFEPENQILGIREGDSLPDVELGDGWMCPGVHLELSIARFGGERDGDSWTAMALDLLSQYGPFQLAWLEMLVRIADWRASATEADARHVTRMSSSESIEGEETGK